MMDQKTKEFFMDNVKRLLEAPSCCAEAKEAAQNWLDAVGTDKENEQSQKLIKELEMDIMPVDGLIAFALSETGEKVFGKDGAKQMAAHGQALKEANETYCDCPACKAAAAILGKKHELI